MRAFEYRQIQLPNFNLENITGSDQHPFADELNQYGRDGWEVAVKLSDTMLLLKRELPTTDHRTDSQERAG